MENGNNFWQRFRRIRWQRNNAIEEQDNGDTDEEENIDERGNLTEMGNRATSRSASEVTFDKSLPRAHSYLGSDLEDVQGRTIHDDDSLISLPILSLNDVVLLPGQILPLFLFQPVAVSMIKRVLDKDRTFGYVAANESGSGVAEVGTTAEVLAVKEDQDDRSGITATKVKAVGRQRFVVIKTRRQIDGTLIANVKILPDKVMGSPLDGATPSSHKRAQYSNSLSRSDDLVTAPKRRKVDRLSGGNFTQWPPWVYKQYDIEHVMSDVKRELQSWNESFSVESLPSDPIEFSYWVAGSLPFEDSVKLNLLRIDTAIQRLRCELSVMRRCSVLRCANCGGIIAHKNDIFSMSVEGPMGAYVNPGGYVHETMTVLEARGLRLIGRPSDEHSWFPGYAWTIAQCRHCAAHMGWRFTLTPGKQLKPEKFFGLCRSSLKPGIQGQNETDESWMPIW